MANLTEWAKTVVGRYIDVDAWAGNQCWDLSQAWLTACNGGTLWTQPSNYPGLAAGSWEVATGNTSNTADLLRHVTAHPGNTKGLPGDIIIWAYGSRDYPISHTAVLIEDRGPILYTLSQNSSPARTDLPGYSVESSGPTIYQELPRAGILGFLRPLTTIAGQGSGITPITEEGFLMALPETRQAQVADAADRTIGTIPDRRTPSGAVVKVAMEDTTFSKADGAYQNRIQTDVVKALGRIENALGTKPDKTDLAAAILAGGSGDPSIIAKAVIDAVGDGLAKEVVDAIGAALSGGAK